jgi:hypothetical protein
MILDILIFGTVLQLILRVLIFRFRGHRSAFGLCPVMGVGVKRFTVIELANNYENNKLFSFFFGIEGTQNIRTQCNISGLILSKLHAVRYMYLLAYISCELCNP